MNLFRRFAFHLVFLTALVARAAAPAVSAPPNTYTNPLQFTVADPFVLRYGNTYYLSGTSAPDGFKMWTSYDLVHWVDHGYCYERHGNSWAHDYFWAPAMIYRNGWFYFYYSARGPVGRGHDSERICVACSRTPLGPYRDVAAPMFNFGQADIDVHVFIDDDGRGYIYYVKDCSENFTAAGKPISEVYAAPLNANLLSIPPGVQPTFCIRPDHRWEGIQWNEGPFVFKHKNTYIMMYSANFFASPEYSLGYATSSTPLGPWQKAPDNPVLKQTKTVKGPGHNAVIASPDGTELFCIYHELNPIPGHERLLAIDRMKITDLPNGGIRLKILGPSTTPQRLPSGSPYSR